MVFGYQKKNRKYYFFEIVLLKVIPDETIRISALEILFKKFLWLICGLLLPNKNICPKNFLF